MLTYRTTKHPNSADQAFAAMLRHHKRQLLASASGPPMPPPPPPPASLVPDEEGDIIYGARAIAQYLFGNSDDRTRRRVFCLAQHYLARNEKAGFFKLKAAICLSKSRWKKFHGLG